MMLVTFRGETSVGGAEGTAGGKLEIDIDHRTAVILNSPHITTCEATGSAVIRQNDGFEMTRDLDIVTVLLPHIYCEDELRRIQSCPFDVMWTKWITDKTNKAQVLRHNEAILARTLDGGYRSF